MSPKITAGRCDMSTKQSGNTWVPDRGLNRRGRIAVPDCADEQREDIGVLVGADWDWSRLWHWALLETSLLNSPHRTYKADLQSLKFGHIGGFVSCWSITSPPYTKRQSYKWLSNQDHMNSKRKKHTTTMGMKLKLFHFKEYPMDWTKWKTVCTISLWRCGWMHVDVYVCHLKWIKAKTQPKIGAVPGTRQREIRERKWGFFSKLPWNTGNKPQLQPPQPVSKKQRDKGAISAPTHTPMHT